MEHMFVIKCDSQICHEWNIFIHTPNLQRCMGKGEREVATKQSRGGRFNIMCPVFLSTSFAEYKVEPDHPKERASKSIANEHNQTCKNLNHKSAPT